MSAPYHHGNLRRALLDRAIVALHEKGVEELSLRALARDLGVSHAAPLRHFSTKSELLMAIAKEGVQSLVEATVSARKKKPGLDRLRETASAYVQWARENSVYHRVLRNPDVMRHAPETLHDLLRKFAKLQMKDIESAQENGWRTDENAAVIFLHYVSLTAGTAIVSTDDLYQIPLGEVISGEALSASLELFLSDA